MQYRITNILDLLEITGEDELKLILSDFSCIQNKEIENFLHNNAIEFAKRKMSITYLVFDEEGQIAAYFTLTHKSSAVRGELLSRTAQKKLSMHARYDTVVRAYSVSAFLIAQFGKNSAYKNAECIRGNMLMDMALTVLKGVQKQIGGGVVFLECENRPKLLEFYQNDHNNFKIYGERFSGSDGITYLQMLKFL